MLVEAVFDVVLLLFLLLLNVSLGFVEPLQEPVALLH